VNEFILADMATERLTREIGMVAKPLPKEIKVLQKDLPSGKVRYESALYQSEKLKKIAVSKRSNGRGGVGATVMLISRDEYDFPFVLVDLAFSFFKEHSISSGFHLRPLVKDEESQKRYIEPFKAWREAIGKLPGETITLDLGPFMKANPPPLKYVCSLPDSYLDEVLKYINHFFDILLDVYRKVEPVKDARRRKKIDNFRAEYNQKIFGDDYSGKVLIETFGPQIAALFYDYFVYL